MKLLFAMTLTALLTTNSQAAADLKTANALLARAEAANAVVLDIGHNCSQYMRAKRIEGVLCLPMDAETRARLCGKTLEDSVFKPINEKLIGWQKSLSYATCAELGGVVKNIASEISKDALNLEKGDSRMKETFTRTREYPLCSEPRDAKDPYSNLEGLAYQSLRNSIYEANKRFAELAKLPNDALCRQR